MGFVEFGSSIGSAIGSAASAVGGAVSRGVESGPSIGSVGFSAPAMETGGPVSFGQSLLGGIAPIVNEGPVGPSFLEATMPYIFNPTGEILFNSFPKEVTEPSVAPEVDVIAEAGEVAAQAWVNPLPEQKSPERPTAKLSESEVAAEANDGLKTTYWFVETPDRVKYADVFMSEPRLMTKPLRKSQVLEEAEAVAAKAWDNHVITQTENVVNQAEESFSKTTPAPAEQVLKEEVEEVQTAIKEVVETGDEEQIDRVKIGLVEDASKTITREVELDQATELAAFEAQALGVNGIEGWRIVNKLIPQHPGDRSETLNEEDPQNTITDGSWESVKEDIRTRKFASLEKAKRVLTAINRKYRPEKRGDGDDITEEEHERVHKDHRHSSNRPLRILERRIVKKGVQAASMQPRPVVVNIFEQPKQERNLEDLNLAEVFPKAASGL